MVRDDRYGRQNRCISEDVDLKEVTAPSARTDVDETNERSKRKTISTRHKRSTIFEYSSSLVPALSSSTNADKTTNTSKETATKTLSEIPSRRIRLTVSKVHCVVDHFDEIYHHIRDSFPESRHTILAHYNPLVNVPQFGTRCGLVALSMASQMFIPMGARKLFEEAKNLGLTLVGEMFDAYKMAEFATNQLKCEARVICNLNIRKYDMLSHICDGWPVLIPYDECCGLPVVNFGRTAHWAVLHGLFFKAGLTVDSGRQLRRISTTKGLYVKERLLFDCQRSTPDSDIFVLAHEGLQRELLAWRLDALLISNCNLWKFPKGFGLPREYELPNLRDKAVLLKNRESNS